MTNCWPNVSLKCCASERASRSVPPPAANGRMTVTGRDGQAWAKTTDGVDQRPIAAIASAILRVIRIFTMSSPRCPAKPRRLFAVLVEHEVAGKKEQGDFTCSPFSPPDLGEAERLVVEIGRR